MALTLAEGAKLSNDVLLEGVIETVINDSPVLQRMPFIEIVGNGLTYNRENAAATAGFYAVGATWAESTPTFTQVTAALKILGGARTSTTTWRARATTCRTWRRPSSR